ncbi:MAG: flagellar biosynthesis protein FlhF [Planctomycetota bacterium]
MHIEIFRAANLQAALEEIRATLGPDASVLRTRQCPDPMWGWLGRSYVEVHATNDDVTDDSHGESSSLEHQDGDLDSQAETGFPRLRSSDALKSATRPNDRLNERLTEPRTDPLFDYRTGLITLGVTPHVADRWLRATNGFLANVSDRDNPFANTTNIWAEHLRQSVAREIHLAGPIQLMPGERRVVALVGPTGVGKTTTVAKLAAGFRMRSKRRVGLLTIDTFRIAAVQQLQAYAQLMDLPMVVVESPPQMPDALQQLGDVDVVLIDTAGRSPRGDLDIGALAEMLRSAQPDETHLVLSATSTAAVIQSSLDGFAPTRPTAAILTKLDEAPYTAAILSSVAEGPTDAGLPSGVPLSYVTHGQHVPDDISVASTDELVSRLLPVQAELNRVDVA